MPSAAEPAHPEHTTMGPPGKILRFAQRTARTGAGRRTPQPQPSEEPAVAATPQQRLALQAEGFLNDHGETLTDDRTAEVYRKTLTLVQLMLGGCLAEDLIAEEQHEHLAGMVEGLRRSPDSL